MLYMVTFTINIPPMLAYIPYMDPMGIVILLGTQERIEAARREGRTEVQTSILPFGGMNPYT